MRSEEMKALGRHELLVWNEGDWNAFDDLYASTFINRSNGNDFIAHKHAIEMLRIAFPDVCITIVDHLVDGDKLIARWTGTGTHENTFIGIPATHKKVEIMGITIFRVANGKFVEGWINGDDAGLMRQLGVTMVPPNDTAQSH